MSIGLGGVPRSGVCCVSRFDDGSARDSGSSCFRSLRNILLMSVAVGGLVLSDSPFVYAQDQGTPPANIGPIIPLGEPDGPCSLEQGAVTCTGDLSGGIKTDSRYDDDPDYGRLNVNGLIRDIAPDHGTDGILLGRSGPIELLINTGDYGITTNGAIGVHGNSEAGPVAIDHTGRIYTKGGTIYAHGIFGHSSSKVVRIIHGDGSITTEGKNSRGIYADARGRYFSITNNGDIRTAGSGADIDGEQKGSHGLLGLGGSDVSTIANTGNINTGGKYSKGIYGVSSGGRVDIVNEGDIETEGEDAYGIYGISGSPTSTDRSANDVDITNTGSDIRTKGKNAQGIYAYSRNNGVIVTNNGGSITTSGENAKGIYARSDADDSTVTVDLKGDGSIVSEHETGIGVQLFGKGKNDLVINGNSRTTISGGRFDIAGDNLGADVISNHGVLTSPGIIDLEGGDNAFNNAVGALFNAGSHVRLGRSNLFTNAGEVSPAGADTVGKTVIEGGYIQEGTGVYMITVDPSAEEGKRADLLAVTEKAIFRPGAKLAVNLLNPLSQPLELLVLKAGQGVDGDVRQLVDAGSGYTVHKGEAGDELWLLASFDPSVPPVPPVPPMKDLSSSIIPSVHGALISHAQGNVDLINARLQIADADDAGEAGVMGLSSNAMQSNRDSRFWASVQGTRGKHEAVSLSPELKSRQTGLALGFDQQVSENLRLGIMASHVRGNFDQNVGNASGKDKTFSLGAYGSARVSSSSPLRIGFGGLYNWHRLEGSRTPEETGVSLSSSHKAHSWQLFGEASYRVDMSNGFSLEPFAGLSHMNFKSDPFTETGGDGALQASSSSRKTTFSTLGVRGRVKVDDTLRVYGMAGWRRAFGKVVPSVEFSHVNGPSSPFMISGSPIARNSALVQVGASFALSSDTSLSASYTGQYAKKIRTHGANVKLNVKF